MRLSLVILILTTAAIFSGCTSKSEELCENVIKAATKFQTLHLTAPLELRAESFRSAQVNLLMQYKVKTDSPRPATALGECKLTLDTLHKGAGTVEMKDLALELLGSFARQWDPHSSVLTEQELINENGFQNGYGFRVEKSSENASTLEVIDVIAGSPAHSAGLHEGMFVTSINRHEVRELDTKALATTINDKTASGLVLGIQIGQEPVREITLRREKFEASPIKLETFTTARSSLGYLKLRNFVGALAFFAEAVKTLRSSAALILDLRNISGGDIQAAADIGDLLNSNGESFVGFLGRDLAPEEPLRLRNPSSIWDGPLVVLVNGGTKSAAEILAGALQDYGAVVVGTQTFGKGTRQRRHSLSDFGLSGAIEITDGFTVRPSGQVIQFNGITPDLIVNSTHGLQSTKRESSYVNFLIPPQNQAPLHGYDPTMLPTRPENFHKKLHALQNHLELLSQSFEFISEEDLQLEAAKRVALFLASEAEKE